MSVVRRYPLIAFFVLAYAFSWWPWPLYALDLIPGYIVGFGPFLAALVVAIANGPEHLSGKRAKQTPAPPEGARPTPRVA
jgi:hypothetical protein